MYYFIMKIPNKWELQQIAFNYSTDILFKGFMNIYKKCTAKPFSFFVIHGTFASDNLSRFRKNLLEKKLKLILATDHKIKDKKKYNMILTEKQQKYQLYDQVKLININILQMKKFYLIIKDK